MNDDSPDTCVLDLVKALRDAFARLRRARVALDEANTQDAAEVARAEVARAEARLRVIDRYVAEFVEELGPMAAEFGAGVEHQWARAAALLAAIRSQYTAPLCREGERANLENAEVLERVEAALERAEHLLMRWEAQGASVKTRRAWLVQLAASILPDAQPWVVSPSWSPWTGLAPPAVPPIVQRK
jgi:hypothetical protein